MKRPTSTAPALFLAGRLSNDFFERVTAEGLCGEGRLAGEGEPHVTNPLEEVGF
ncbi:MAG: hypothetical protein M3416_17000 [Acidobacteriota bacterium]|nr:hypothetical protein [Acidobacteriota bacterium]